MMNRTRQIRGACLRHLMNQNRQMKNVLKTQDEPESPNEGACLRYIMMNRNRHMRGRV